MSSVDDETIIEVLAESDAARLTTTEIAEELPLTRGTVRTRLQALADEGRLDRERDGRDVVWFLPDRAEEPSSESEADEGSGAAEDDADQPRDDHAEETETEAATGAEPEAEPADEENGETAEHGDEPEGEETTAAVTERGETVDTGADHAEAGATGPPVVRDDDALVRAAVAALLLAAIYYVVRRIREDA